jgi:2-keto-4-pentenoate hydratase/2-oxohepta-3-ene-1,7-dioic acid hydratase in catechol pathway
MRLASININSEEIAGIVVGNGIILLKSLNRYFCKKWNTDLQSILETEQMDEIIYLYNSIKDDITKIFMNDLIPFEKVKYAPLYRKPSKIWGIGLNYVEHAKDLSEKNPTDIPASFMKAFTTIIGYNDEILIPELSEKTTGEAELGIVIGKKCKNIERENWLDFVAGFTSIIDMTAEDILRKNPRYLTVSKNFDTFFSFGPHMITKDEIDDVLKLNVATILNGQIIAQNTISNMLFPPDFLVSFHSKVMTLLPGDIISTGTPRAVQINNGDKIECRIDGFESLCNIVRDLKLSRNNSTPGVVYKTPGEY